jgi:hypothetical protein
MYKQITKTFEPGKTEQPKQASAQPPSKSKSEAQIKATQEKNAAKKANKAARKTAAVAPGAQIDNATAETAAIIVVQATMRANQAQAKKTQVSTQQTHAPAPVRSTTAAAQRKKKGRRQRVKKMAAADKTILQQLETDHMLKLRGLVKDCKTHEEYANALHDEFVHYATEKQSFYQNLPDGPKKQLFVERAERNLKKANEYQARTPSMPPDVFAKYQGYKLDCIKTLEEIETLSLTPEDRKKQRRDAFEHRRTQIQALLDSLKGKDEDVKRAELRQKYGFDK